MGSREDAGLTAIADAFHLPIAMTGAPRIAANYRLSLREDDKTPEAMPNQIIADCALHSW
jgi:hypothetical protein